MLLAGQDEQRMICMNNTKLTSCALNLVFILLSSGTTVTRMIRPLHWENTPKDTKIWCHIFVNRGS